MRQHLRWQWPFYSVILWKKLCKITLFITHCATNKSVIVLFIRLIHSEIRSFIKLPKNKHCNVSITEKEDHIMDKTYNIGDKHTYTLIEFLKENNEVRQQQNVLGLLIIFPKKIPSYLTTFWLSSTQTHMTTTSHPRPVTQTQSRASKNNTRRCMWKRNNKYQLYWFTDSDKHFTL